MLVLPTSPTTASYPTRAFDNDFSAIERPLAQYTQRVTYKAESAQSTSLVDEATLLDTETRLLLTRTEKILPAIWQDWQSKQIYLEGVNAQDALIRVRRLLLAVPLAASTISAGFTHEQSLYIRAELPGQAGGTLYIEVNLGDEADNAEDSFVAIRKDKQEKWYVSGPFAQVLAKLRYYFSAQS